MSRHRLAAAIVVTSVVTVSGIACRSPASLDGAAGDAWPARLDDAAFWSMVRGFSEPGGTFTPQGGYRSDNLVSNERSVQQVIPSLLGARRSGAYIGVGPEQNFTFITALEPVIAFVIDIRPENQTLHLLYKALAEGSTDRADFLARLFARPRPAGLTPGATPDALFAAFEAVPWSATLAQTTLEAALERLTTTHGFPLSLGEQADIAALHARFGDSGPTMRWDSTGGAWVPSYAELMADTDGGGVQRSYLASEAAFQTFRQYQLRNRIVPLIGDFGGTVTLAAVGRYLAANDTVVAVFYLSNVEAYLQDKAPRFARSVAALPWGPGGFLVRTSFRQTGHTGSRPDYRTSTMAEPVPDFIARWAN
jgi:hypothetical protein